MAISIVDTAPVVAAADNRDRHQTLAQQALLSAPGELIIPAPVTQEVDYLLGERVGPEAQLAFLADIVDGTFRVECLTSAEYEQAMRLSREYGDLRVGLADLSVVILAARFNTRTIVTFDQRHFRVLRPLQGGVFTLLPWDAGA